MSTTELLAALKSRWSAALPREISLVGLDDFFEQLARHDDPRFAAVSSRLDDIMRRRDRTAKMKVPQPPARRTTSPPATDTADSVLDQLALRVAEAEAMGALPWQKHFYTERGHEFGMLSAAWRSAILDPSDRNNAVQYILSDRAERATYPDLTVAWAKRPWEINLAANEAGWVVDRFALGTAENELSVREQTLKTGEVVPADPRLVKWLTQLRSAATQARRLAQPSKKRPASDIETVDRMDLGDGPLQRLLRNFEQEMNERGTKRRANPRLEMEQALRLAAWVRLAADLYNRPDYLEFAMLLERRAAAPKSLRFEDPQVLTVLKPALEQYVAGILEPDLYRKYELFSAAAAACPRKPQEHRDVWICMPAVYGRDWAREANEARAAGILAPDLLFNHPSYWLRPDIGVSGTHEYAVVDAANPFQQLSGSIYPADDGGWTFHIGGTSREPTFNRPQDAAWALLKSINGNTAFEESALAPPRDRLPLADRLLARVEAIDPKYLTIDQERMRQSLLRPLSTGSLARDEERLAFVERDEVAYLEQKAREAGA